MKLSIIIPVYNSEKYLADCLESCLNQDPFKVGKDYEIICVDDGSNDRSSEILSKYKSRGINVIHQENAGVSMARNNGISHAKGDYIWCVDSDDLIAPHCVPKLLVPLCVGGHKGCSFGYERVSENINLKNITSFRGGGDS